MQFRGEEKPSKHRFKALRVDKTYLCASDTSKVGSFGVSQPLEIAGKSGEISVKASKVKSIVRKK